MTDTRQETAAYDVIAGNDGTNYVLAKGSGQFLSVGRTDSELRSFGWIGDLDGDLKQFREDFVGHIDRVDKSTKLTQAQFGKDSQVSHARRVLKLFDEFYSALSRYGYANVKGEVNEPS